MTSALTKRVAQTAPNVPAYFTNPISANAFKTAAVKAIGTMGFFL
jgi:hypothetical protein